MVVHRFFAPSLDPGDETVALPNDEADHLTRVLRLSTGDTVAVFDGRGNEFLACVVAGERRRDVRVRLLSRVVPAAEPVVPITLVQAVLKGDKMDEVVRDAVMLGVAAVHPIVTRRSETTVAAVIRGSRLDRWRRVALASVKQSRRAMLPEIRIPLGLEDFLAEPPASLRLMLVEPPSLPGPGEPLRRLGPSSPSEPAPQPGRPEQLWSEVESIGALRREPVPADAAVLVGPEGGWTEEERTLAVERSVRLVTLGPRTLRADAVPVAAISVLQFLWNDL